MRRLRDEGVIEEEHVQVWRTVRNSVAHGNLVSPWSDKEQEERMHLLAEMFHRMSMKYIQQRSS